MELRRSAQLCGEGARELQAEVRRLGGNADESGKYSGNPASNMGRYSCCIAREGRTGDFRSL